MPKQVIVKQGQCCNSLAYEHGFKDVAAIWDDGGNSELRQKRKSPEHLLEGDTVSIPDRADKQESLSEKAVTKIVVTRPTITFTKKFLDSQGNGLAGNFELLVDGKTYSGSLAGGTVEQKLPAICRTGILTVTFDSGAVSTTHIKFGFLDPANTVSGAQARLIRAGWLTGEVTGALDPATTRALEQFQDKNKLSVTGQIDDATADALAALDEP